MFKCGREQDGHLVERQTTHCLISKFHCAAVSQSKTYQVAMEKNNIECNTGYFFTIPKHACDKFSLSEQSFPY